MQAEKASLTDRGPLYSSEPMPLVDALLPLAGPMHERATDSKSRSISGAQRVNDFDQKL